jgi:hypothetical protein
MALSTDISNNIMFLQSAIGIGAIKDLGTRTPELLAKIDIPRQKLYYLEQKGFIKPQKTTIGEKEFREYSDEDVKKVEYIWKYLKKGFKYKIAYAKAMDELLNPQLNLLPPVGKSEG